MTAAACSPVRGVGCRDDRALGDAGIVISASSISAAEMLAPPRMMMSLTRSVMVL